jgi:hypothetical protein
LLPSPKNHTANNPYQQLLYNADTADDDADDINGDDTDDDKDVFDTGEPTVQPTEYVETPTPLPTVHSGMGVSVFVVQTNTAN